MKAEEGTTATPAPQGHRWFAALYDWIMRANEKRIFGRLRRRLLADLRGDVVEIGAGTGANFAYYVQEARVLALEPDPFMLKRAVRRAADLGATNVELKLAPAERLPLADASCDAVVCTLVLCTADDVPTALSEVKRVLRPDGRFVFMEHVRGEGLLGRFHDIVRPVWRWASAGCNPNRRTEAAIRAAGFAFDSIERTGSFPTPIISGVARVERL
jgi:ubiquinone/menaquinone biosynthesis C-methylase UbiE